jgi:competence protein ComGC
MKNQKGVTIVEIVVCVALISLVIIFIFNLMITVKNINDDSNSSSTNIINQNIIIRRVQADFKDLKLTQVDSCSSDEIKNLMVSNYNQKTSYCLKFSYASVEVGYLIYYSYHNNNSNKDLNIIGYSRENNVILRETDIAPKNNNEDNENNKYPLKVNTSCSDTSYDNCALNIVMPVVDSDDNNYDINLNYIYASNEVIIN